MSRPVETGGRGLVREPWDCVRIAQCLEHCGLQAYPMTPVMQWEVSWALEQGRN